MEFTIFLATLIIGVAFYALGLAKKPRLTALMGIGSLMIISVALMALDNGVQISQLSLNATTQHPIVYNSTKWVVANTTSKNVSSSQNVTYNYKKLNVSVLLLNTSYDYTQLQVSYSTFDNTDYLLILLAGFSMLFFSFFQEENEGNESDELE